MEFIKCDYCHGEGWTFHYVGLGGYLPKEQKCCCINCNGQGKLIVIPDGYNTIRESEIKKD